jgi:acyl-coenzyme A thioesterase PaaI-like protein
MRMDRSPAAVVREALLAPNGYLHAGALVNVADSSCSSGSERSVVSELE